MQATNKNYNLQAIQVLTNIRNVPFCRNRNWIVESVNLLQREPSSCQTALQQEMVQVKWYWTGDKYKELLVFSLQQTVLVYSQHMNNHFYI